MHWTLLPFDDLSVKTLYELLRLRAEVFVVEQTCPYQDLDRTDFFSWHLYSLNDAMDPQAYARLIPPGVLYAEASIGRVVTSSSVRGQGVGRELFAVALQEAERLWPRQPVRIMAQSYLLSFYTSYGFIPVGAEFLEDGIPHIYLLRPSQS